MHWLTTIPRRAFNLAGFLICAGLLGFAYYLQFQQGLEPCPLCIFQRIVFWVLAILFLAATLHDPRRIGRRIYGLLLLIAGLAGAAIAARHVWIQNLPPDQVPGCGPDLSYMLETMPLDRVIKKAFAGSGDCAVVLWRFLGLSIPAWTLVWYLVLGGLGFVRNTLARD